MYYRALISPVPNECLPCNRAVCPTPGFFPKKTECGVFTRSSLSLRSASCTSDLVFTLEEDGLVERTNDDPALWKSVWDSAE